MNEFLSKMCRNDVFVLKKRKKGKFTGTRMEEGNVHSDSEGDALELTLSVFLAL